MASQGSTWTSCIGRLQTWSAVAPLGKLCVPRQTYRAYQLVLEERDGLAGIGDDSVTHCARIGFDVDDRDRARPLAGIDGRILRLQAGHRGVGALGKRQVSRRAASGPQFSAGDVWHKAEVQRRSGLEPNARTPSGEAQYLVRSGKLCSFRTGFSYILTLFNLSSPSSDAPRA